MMKAKQVLTTILICSLSLSLVACGKNNKQDNTTTTESATQGQEQGKENSGGFSDDKTSYTIKSQNVNTDKDTVTINIPQDIVVMEDTNESSNQYISLYNVGDGGMATEDDYVLTYKVVNEDEIQEDLVTTSDLYKNMYADLQTTDIVDEEIDGIPYKYYTVSYTSNDTTLTDYVVQFNIDGTYVLSKVGTTFYPLKMSKDEVVKLALDNIRK